MPPIRTERVPPNSVLPAPISSTKGKLDAWKHPSVQLSSSSVEVGCTGKRPHHSLCCRLPDVSRCGVLQGRRGCLKHRRTLLNENRYARAPGWRQTTRQRSSLTVSPLLSRSSSLLWSVDTLITGTSASATAPEIIHGY